MEIEVAQWLPPFHGPAEIGRTSAEIRIRFGEENATRLEEDWSQSVQQHARLAAYPLALWLASSWWRIRWEPLPRVRLRRGGGADDVDWRMSHELPAAGYGFLWPQLTFASDGEFIQARCRRSDVSEEPIRYLSDFETMVPATAFERGVDSFLSLVLERLDTQAETDLHRLWTEVQAERRDEEMSLLRRLEARLGFDPDRAPQMLLEDIVALTSRAGVDAAAEIAPACAGSQPARTSLPDRRTE